MPGVANTFAPKRGAGGRDSFQPPFQGLGKRRRPTQGVARRLAFALGYFLSPRRGCREDGVTASRTSPINQPARQRLPSGLLLCGSAAYALCVILAALGISVKSAS